MIGFSRRVRFLSHRTLLWSLVRGRPVRAERRGRRRSAARGAGQLDTRRDPAAAGDRTREPHTAGYGRRTSDHARDDHEQVPVPGLVTHHPDQSQPGRHRSHRQGNALLCIHAGIIDNVSSIVFQTIEEKNALIIQQEEHIKEMMAVMSLASRLEAEKASKKEETIGRLQTENQVCTFLFWLSIFSFAESPFVTTCGSCEAGDTQSLHRFAFVPM